MKIGYIGLGLMGGPLARNLIRAGKEVKVFDLNEESIKRTLAVGTTGVGVKSADELADCDVVFTSLPLPVHIKSTMIGENGLLNKMKEGSVYIDVSTIDPQTAQELEDFAAARGIGFMGCPLGKGPAQAEKAEQPIFAGGKKETFEKDLETFVGEDKRVVALSAGTAAVHLALLACGVGPGDEVLVQSFTFCASSHPITYLGAIPVFVDSEPQTWNMDPELLEEAIKDRISKTGKKPKAIIPVALYGMPYDCDRIMEVANRYDIPVIEDVSEGFGSKYKRQVLGTFGRYGVLSFNGNKMIPAPAALLINCSVPETVFSTPAPARPARQPPA